MNKIAVIYWSGTGNTEVMAKLVREGAMAAGGETDLLTAAQFDPKKAKEYDAIGLGCPSMGTEQLEETEFEPMYQEIKPFLRGKGVVLFGSYGWGDGEWMRNWEEDCRAVGCRLLDEPLIVQETPDFENEKRCRTLGEVLARG